MIVCDSQIHLFPPGTEERAAQFGQRPLSLEEILAEMDGAGVDRAVLVPPNPAHLAANLEAAHRHPARLRSVGVVALNRAEAGDELRRWRDAGWLGVRLVFPPWHRQSWLSDGTADWLWPLAEELGMPVMAWAPGQLGELGEIARRHPGLKLAVDHLGLAVEDRDEAIDRVLDTLAPLARLHNVCVKASTLPNHVSESFPFPSLHGRISRVVEAFGPERVFFGSDLTGLHCSYGEAVELFTERVGLAPSERELVMGGALLAWSGWDA